MLHLLFDRKRAFLGEVATKDGAMDRVTLTDDGEREIGALVKLWQTRGVPIRKEIASKDAEGRRRQLVFYKEYVAPRSKKFADALGMWASDYAVTVIALDDRRLPLWQMLARLPLLPEERFAYLVVLRQTPEELLPEWKEAFEEALRAGNGKVLQTQAAMKKGNPFMKK